MIIINYLKVTIHNPATEGLVQQINKQTIKQLNMLGEFLSNNKSKKTLWLILGLCLFLITAGLILSLIK
jgi:hypothetical protein